VPSLAQPAGADQGLYAYVGQRILAGEQPYLDAWDQKPPGIHLVYAALFAIWPYESVIPAADFACAALTAVLLWRLGAILAPATLAGPLSAVLYLLLSDPSLTRLAGVRIRAQAEVFIGLAVTAAMVLIAAGPTDDERTSWRRLHALGAGMLLGLAAVLKYNAIVYAIAPALLIAAGGRRVLRDGWRSIVLLGIGALIPVAMMLAHFAFHRALEDWYLATIVYNVEYSGETYAGPLAFLRYLFTMPVRQARLDSLFLLGGAGTAFLLIAGWRHPRWLAVPAWVAVAVLSIAINGSRGLPQYFVQAAAPLACASGLALAVGLGRVRPAIRVLVIVLLSVAVWRVTDFPRAVRAFVFDWQGFTGQIDRRAYLSRFGRADSADKYSALAVHDLADYIRSHSRPADSVLVFGFSPWAYVGAHRRSASRFFWSRPVIVGFEASRPEYGVRGLLDDLERNRPSLVVLQHRDWDPVEANSDEFWKSQPALVRWLEAGYVPGGMLHNFEIWTSRDGAH
jgi:hypothetical protein